MIRIATFILLGCALYASLDWGIYRFNGGDFAITEYWVGHKWGLSQ